MDHPIDDAIERVEQKAADRATATARAEIPLFTQAHFWAPERVATIDAQPGPRPTLMIWDNAAQAWRGVVLPDGTRWIVSWAGRADGIIVP